MTIHECRDCGRTDVRLKKDGTLHQHKRPKTRGYSRILPADGYCYGSGHPPKGVLGPYALKVLAVLRPYFPSLRSADVADHVGDSIEQHRITQRVSYEFSLSTHWSLAAHPEIPVRVRVVCKRLSLDQTAVDVEDEINRKLDEIRVR